MTTGQAGWQGVARFFGALGFLSFALWLFATKFDESEVKTLLVAAGPIAAREFWPMLRGLLAPTTEALSKGRLE